MDRRQEPPKCSRILAGDRPRPTTELLVPFSDPIRTQQLHAFNEHIIISLAHVYNHCINRRIEHSNTDRYLGDFPTNHP